MKKHVSEQDNFIFLTVALVLLLLVAAVADQFAGSSVQRLVPAATVVTLAIAVWSVKNTRTWFRTGIGFFIAIFGILVAGQFLDTVGLHYAHLSLLMVFFAGTGWLALRQVLFTGDITGNKILGAICVYLLLGLTFATVFLLIVQFSPDAFKGANHSAWYDNFADFVYFSFVSLTTLGFGDITPVKPLARFLVYFEAIAGQFYLTILVASLVGMHISKRLSDSN